MVRRRRRWLWLFLAVLAIGCGFGSYSGSDPFGETTDAGADVLSGGDASADSSDPLASFDAAPWNDAFAYDAGTDAAPGYRARFFFTTRETFAGDLGGAVGADALCFAIAADAGLGPSYATNPYRALLAAGGGDASTLSPGSIYVRVDHAIIGTRAEMVQAPILGLMLDGGVAYDQRGEVIADGKAVWTGLTANLSPAASSCNGFQSASVAISGHVGVPTDGTEWASSNSGLGDVVCNALVHLYCFQAN